jgi:hypothetical protein
MTAFYNATEDPETRIAHPHGPTAHATSTAHIAAIGGIRVVAERLGKVQSPWRIPWWVCTSERRRLTHSRYRG